MEHLNREFSQEMLLFAIEYSQLKREMALDTSFMERVRPISRPSKPSIVSSLSPMANNQRGVNKSRKEPKKKSGETKSDLELPERKTSELIFDENIEEVGLLAGGRDPSSGTLNAKTDFIRSKERVGSPSRDILWLNFYDGIPLSDVVFTDAWNLLFEENAMKYKSMVHVLYRVSLYALVGGPQCIKRLFPCPKGDELCCLWECEFL